MGVEVVYHQGHFAGHGVMQRQDFFDEAGPVFFRVTLGNLGLAFAPQKFTGDEEIALPFLFVGIILLAILSPFCWFGQVFLFHQDAGSFHPGTPLARARHRGGSRHPAHLPSAGQSRFRGAESTINVSARDAVRFFPLNGKLGLTAGVA
jgi:hypothetical protein